MFGEIVPGGLKIREKEGAYKSWCMCEFRKIDAVDKLLAKPVEVDFEPEDEAAMLQERKRPTLKIKRADVQGELKKKAAKGESGALAYTASSVAAVAPVANASGEVVEKLQKSAIAAKLRRQDAAAAEEMGEAPTSADEVRTQAQQKRVVSNIASAAVESGTAGPGGGGGCALEASGDGVKPEQPAGATIPSNARQADGSGRGLRRYNSADVEPDVSLKEGLAQQMVLDAAAQMQSPDGSVRSSSPDISLASLNADWQAETNSKTMRQKVRAMPGRHSGKKSIATLRRFQSVDVGVAASIFERRSPLGALPPDNGVDIADGSMKLSGSGIDTAESKGNVSLASTKEQLPVHTLGGGHANAGGVEHEGAGMMSDLHAWKDTMSEMGGLGRHSPPDSVSVRREDEVGGSRGGWRRGAARGEDGPQ